MPSKQVGGGNIQRQNSQMKRFTETTKWDDPWFQDLNPAHKLFWIYLCDNCDNTGVWKVNWRLANFQIGVDLKKEELLPIFGKRIHVLDEERWLIVSFICFQYGELSEECRPHKPILALIKKHNLQRVLIGYSKGINTLEEKDKEKDKIKKGEFEGVNPFAPLEEKSKKKAASEQEAVEFCRDIGLKPDDGSWFWDKCEGSGWKNAGKPIVDWKAVVRSWQRIAIFPSQKNQNQGFQKPKQQSLPMGIPEPI